MELHPRLGQGSGMSPEPRIRVSTLRLGYEGIDEDEGRTDRATRVRPCRDRRRVYSFDEQARAARFLSIGLASNHITPPERLHRQWKL